MSRRTTKHEKWVKGTNLKHGQPNGLGRWVLGRRTPQAQITLIRERMPGGIGSLRYSPSWRSDSGAMMPTVTFLHLNGKIVR